MISNLGIRIVARERAAGPSGLFPCQQPPYLPPRSDPQSVSQEWYDSVYSNVVHYSNAVYKHETKFVNKVVCFS